SDIKFDAVYSSDLTRTVETAKLLLAENKATDEKIESTTMPEFREVFFGSMEGMKGNEVWKMVADHLGYESTKELFRHTDIPQRLNSLREVDPYGDAENFMMFW